MASVILSKILTMRNARRGREYPSVGVLNDFNHEGSVPMLHFLGKIASQNLNHNPALHWGK